MHPAYFVMQCIVMTVEDVLELRLETKHLSDSILHRNVVMGFAQGRLVLPGHLGGQHLRSAVFPKAEVGAQKRQAAPDG